MDKVLYDLMDWPEIEAVVYSECRKPKDILGEHVTKAGLLFQFFIPGAIQVDVLCGGKRYECEMVDEAGYFALLIPGKRKLKYTLKVTNPDYSVTDVIDPYSFNVQILDSDLAAFDAGINYEVYNVLGAHPMTIDGVEGVNFAVWAPNAWRVSVVGNFNNWDGRTHQMHINDKYGVFELFVPGLKENDIYKYEIKSKGAKTCLKADPYGFFSELRPDNASVVYDINKYIWTDSDWMKERQLNKTKPMSIYELHLGSFMKPDDGREFYTYRELAPKVISYIKEMGYTHVEIMPIMEHPFDGSWGYQVTGYYAPTSRYGTPDDFKFFIDLLHCSGIGVILDWVPAHFPKDEVGLANFDGTCLYEHQDKRQGEHPEWGTLIYNYGRPQVKNFLIANALFWAKEYHVDGIRMDAVASMLYLDYGKKNGEWVANIYGGNENLDAVEFFKHLNSVFKKRIDGAMLIAEESTAWPKVTGDVEDDSLGFDYKWNMGWMNDFLDFMSADPLFRKGRYGELTFSMIYAYSEDFILVISHDEVVHGKCSMINKMPEADLKLKFADLRAAYGFMFTHPGKKLLFMGQDIAQYNEWWEEKSVDWDELDKPLNKQLNTYVKALNKLYRSEPALYELDYSPVGFTWINNISADECIVVYERKAANGDTLVIAVSFTPVERDNYKIGVPYFGKYTEIFNSDAVEFGGDGKVNAEVICSDRSECDERDNSICIKIAGLGISVFKYSPFTEAELEEIRIREEENKKKEEERRRKEAKKEEERRRLEAKKEEERRRKEALKEEERLRKEADKRIKDTEKKIKEEEKLRKEEEKKAALELKKLEASSKNGKTSK